ncbi:hypothetical protein [Kitasatospora cheerisanensis]|uniref:Secreted protein n=1 Tax=Kitasatospora cheerisanensis KCTC 2395 TaxID=1348663 RepID=A0A066Z4Y6_9ACTN|nr:hypothetical protein [Kitasatospora cheerisanensis]KDN85411.1 hypothetical protein KCH_29920 [Kitasatospora cheerisanensis KCTC 2395]
MRSGWVQLGAWTAATGAAVALSWLGVHAVLADTVFEGPVALPPPTTASAAAPARRRGDRSALVGLRPAGRLGHPAPGPDPDPTPTRGQASPSRSTSAARRTPSPTGTVHSYILPGGRVALDLRAHDAELVSATPEAGWAMQVWHGDQWMRIVFSKDDRASQVYVTWNGYQPDVQVVPG